MRAMCEIFLSCALLVMTLPVLAQDATATLRIQGNVMVSSGGEFTTAVDGQPVLAGQRVMVGDNGTATVNYGPDCKRTFDSAGVYLIPPGRCDERRKDDKSQEQQASVQGTGSTWTTLAVTLGATAIGATALQQEDDTPPDTPVSR